MSFSVGALRSVPYSILAKSILSLTMLLCLIAAAFGLEQNGVATTWTVIYDSLDIIMVMVCLLMVYCTAGLRVMSDRFTAAYAAFIGAILLSCVVMLADAMQQYMYLEQAEAAMTVFSWVSDIAGLLRELTMLAGVTYMMLGMSEAMRGICEDSAADRVRKLGVIYAAAAGLLLVIASAIGETGSDIAIPLVMISYAVMTALEAAMFVTARRGSLAIWQRYTEKAVQGDDD